MRFLVDECAGPALAEWLRAQGHTVFSVYHEARGSTDAALMEMVLADDWILVTADKDFGGMIHRDGRAHHGVVLLRLDDERATVKIAVMRDLLQQYAERLPGQYVVATERRVRFSKA